MILVAGGEADPNVARLARRLAERGKPAVLLRVGGRGDLAPRLTWELSEDRLWLDGEPLRPRAVFLRYDAFAPLTDPAPETRRRVTAWYHALLSWALAHEDVAFLNRAHGAQHAAKASNLLLARAAGLAIPRTAVSNDLDALDRLDGEGWVTKPVAGGEHAEAVADARGREGWRERFAGAPAFVQERLAAPDLRIYRVGDRWFPFTLTAETVDYRASSNPMIWPAATASGFVKPLAVLMDRLGLDFGAADFKRCPATGRFLFLEVNPAPMFSVFDRLVSGALADAIIDRLLSTRAPSTTIG